MTGLSRMRGAALAAIVACLAAGCTHKPEPAPAPAPAAALVPPSSVTPAPRLAEKEPGPTADSRTIAAVQRALNQLGYDAGTADGMMGPATRRAIVAFQKDHDIAGDGRLSAALAQTVLGEIQSDGPRTVRIKIGKGDTLIFTDGMVEIARSERVVQWGQNDPHSLVAIRPDVTGWPAAARAGLDWATTHALNAPDPAKPVYWSSTALKQRFEIRAFLTLDAQDAALVGGDPTLCRRFEIRSAETGARYPGIACTDGTGSWYIPHSTIRLQRPATELEPATSVNKTRK